MELAGPKGVVPDQERVSDSSRNVWTYYDFSRHDVEKSNISSPGRYFGSPLSKMYRAAGTPTISKLESLGKISFVVEDDDDI